MSDVIGALAPKPDAGFASLCAIAGYYRIAADPGKIARDLAVLGRPSTPQDIVRGAKALGAQGACRLARQREAPHDPADAGHRPTARRRFRHLRRTARERALSGRRSRHALRSRRPARRNWSRSSSRMAVLSSRAAPSGAGVDPKTFGFSWFLPSIWRYRKPLGACAARLAVRPAFRAGHAAVLPDRGRQGAGRTKATRRCSCSSSASSLIGLFDVVLQYLRTYALSHTTNRIDVELGTRLFRHLLRLPLGYFETRAAGQTVARVSELETIRTLPHRPGPVLGDRPRVHLRASSPCLFAYSWNLALIVLVHDPALRR